MAKFVSFGELWHNVDENGNPGTIIHSGDEMPADYPQNSIDWLVKNGYIFDPMPEGAPAAQMQQTVTTEEPAPTTPA